LEIKPVNKEFGGWSHEARGSWQEEEAEPDPDVFPSGRSNVFRIAGGESDLKINILILNNARARDETGRPDNKITLQ
jgi:hypothetical protein